MENSPARDVGDMLLPSWSVEFITQFRLRVDFVTLTPLCFLYFSIH